MNSCFELTTPTILYNQKLNEASFRLFFRMIKKRKINIHKKGEQILTVALISNVKLFCLILKMIFVDKDPQVMFEIFSQVFLNFYWQRNIHIC